MPRVLLRFTAWFVLVLVALGFCTTIPSISEALAQWQLSAPGRTVIDALLVLTVGAVLALWSSALWYAWTDRQPHTVPKWVTLALLVFGNFVGAFFYYFFFVSRRTAIGEKSAAPGN